MFNLTVLNDSLLLFLQWIEDLLCLTFDLLSVIEMKNKHGFAMTMQFKRSTKCIEFAMFFSVQNVNKEVPPNNHPYCTRQDELVSVANMEIMDKMI